MEGPPREVIDTFVSITGTDEAVAVRKLEEHSGDLNEAVNAYFSEGDRRTTRANLNPMHASHDDMMDLDEAIDNIPRIGSPLLPGLSVNHFAFLDPSFAQRAAASAAMFRQEPRVTHPREVLQIPIEVKDSSTEIGCSGQGPIIEDVTGRETSYGPEVHGTVVTDDDDDDLPYAQNPNVQSNTLSSNNSAPSAPPLVDITDYNNDIEEQMFRAAIEASKREAEGLANDSNSGEPENTSRGTDDEIYRAVSMPLERERLRLQVADHYYDSSDEEDMEGASRTVERQGLTTRNVGISGQSVENQEDIEDVEDQPLVRQHSRRIPSGNAESTDTLQRANSPPSSAPPHNIQNDHHFPSEWGGISSEEHDEAVMLEAAMFGGVPEGAAYPFSFPSHLNSTRYPQVTHPPSPTLTAQRLLREQQDDEYLAALQADREKELKAIQDAELHRLEEAAAREAAIEKQKQEEEEKLRKQLEEEELESKLAAKQASLPKEPLPNDEGAVTVVVRMPDGSRQGRRFLRSDNLQVLFDFMDISRTFKPGTYRLVRSYPRRAFTDAESQFSLSDLGLTSKQEALFLEKISG